MTARKQTAETLAATLKAIAEPNRIEILALLSGRRGGETPAWVEANLSRPLSQPTVSHHLRRLYLAGLLTRYKDGVHTYYVLSRTGLDWAVAELRRLR